MSTLIVGAGAVGRVLGWHLHRAGERLGFLVKPAHAGDLEGGIAIGRVGKQPEQFSRFVVASSVADAKKHGPWDRVLLCVSSPALRRGTWLAELAAAIPEATYIGVSPGIDDPAFVQARARHVGWAMFPLMSWVADNATVYWRPPLGAIPISGAVEQVKPLVAALRRGGLPARVHRDVPRALAMSGPLLEMNVVALECAGFRLDALADDRALVADAQAAAVEAVEAAARFLGGKPAPRTARLLAPAVTRPLFRLAPRLVPFDIETYLEQHYTKVAEQTAAGLGRTRAMAAELGLPHAAIDRLRARLDEARRRS